MVAQHYIDQGYPVGKVLSYAGLSSSSFYYQSRDGRRGRKPSQFTFTVHGKRVDNDQVVNDIKALLGKKYVDYGYIKVTWWLRYNKEYRINFKKVYRLMRQEKLLYPQRLTPRFHRNWATWEGPDLQQPFSYWQFDIKYIYIAGIKRNALLLTVLDVNSRWILGNYLGWNIRKEHVKDLFGRILRQYNLPEYVTARSDNGSQFIARMVREYLAQMCITQEFTRPATPQQNGHVEAWHSIVERSICKKMEFVDLNEAKQTFDEFIDFYNTERVHSGIEYKNPKRYLIEKGFGSNLNQIENEQKPQPYKVELFSSL
jgi:transposase InsO family protein